MLILSRCSTPLFVFLPLYVTSFSSQQRHGLKPQQHLFSSVSDRRSPESVVSPSVVDGIPETAQNAFLVDSSAYGSSNPSSSTKESDRPLFANDGHRNEIQSTTHLLGTNTMTSASTRTVSFAESPFFLWLQDVVTIVSFGVSRFFSDILPERPIPSGQKQVPVFWRVAKAIHDESVPWLLSYFVPIATSVLSKNSAPILLWTLVELGFFVVCSLKILTKFNVPNASPQPLLNDRKWEYVQNSVWDSFRDTADKRDFLTEWFYNVPFDRIRREDAISFLAWIRYGNVEERLTPAQRREVVGKDLPKLEQEVNDGEELPSRSSSKGEDVLPLIKFNLEPLRYRHKPLSFYAITHGVKMCFNNLMSQLGFVYVPPNDPKKSLGYFFREGDHRTAEGDRNDSKNSSTPLVFVHGVGGLSYYFHLIKDIADKTTSDIILVDLPFISLQVADDVPSVADQIQSVSDILDDTVGKDKKATFVGHSFGTLILSWMAQSRPERVANCVFLDPICFLLHKRNVLFNFHYQRVDQSIQEGKKWDNPISLGTLINLAGTEMHTNNAMLRHFWWATNALWPGDLDRNKIPTAVLVSEKDEIVPSADVEQIFSHYGNEKAKEESNVNRWKNIFSNSNSGKNDGVMLKAKMLRGASHGEFAFDEIHRKKVVESVLGMMRLNSISEKKKTLDEMNHNSSFTYPSLLEFTSSTPSVPLWKPDTISNSYTS